MSISIVIHTDKAGMVEYLQDKVADLQEEADKATTDKAKRWNQGACHGLELAISAIQDWAEADQIKL